MRVLITGGRYFTDVPLLWRTLDEAHQEAPISCIIEGASDDVTGPYLGADYWASQWAAARDVPNDRYHAEWKRLGKPAGPIRNGRMIAEGKPEHVFAFKGGSGTANMLAQAIAAGIHFRKIG